MGARIGGWMCGVVSAVAAWIAVPRATPIAGKPPARVVLFVTAGPADDGGGQLLAPVLCAEKSGKRMKLRRGAECMGKVPKQATVELADGTQVRALGKSKRWMCPAGPGDVDKGTSYDVQTLRLADEPANPVVLWPPASGAKLLPMTASKDGPTAEDQAAIAGLFKGRTPAADPRRGPRTGGKAAAGPQVGARLDVDLDADGKPERLYEVDGQLVLFGGGGAAPVVLAVDDSAGTAGMVPTELLAITDLDGDGRAELVLRETELVTVHGPDGARRFEAFGCYFL